MYERRSSCNTLCTNVWSKFINCETTIFGCGQDRNLGSLFLVRLIREKIRSHTHKLFAYRELTSVVIVVQLCALLSLAFFSSSSVWVLFKLFLFKVFTRAKRRGGKKETFDLRRYLHTGENGSGSCILISDIRRTFDGGGFLVKWPDTKSPFLEDERDWYNAYSTHAGVAQVLKGG